MVRDKAERTMMDKSIDRKDTRKRRKKTFSQGEWNCHFFLEMF